MTECVDCAFCAPLTDAERDQIFQALLEIVGPRGLVTAPDEIAAASLDSRRRRQGSALALVRAASTEEVSAVVRLAGEWGLCIVPQCGNTSTVGGATPEPESPANRRTIILSLSRMNRILSVDPVNAAMTVEAGVILAKAAEAAREAGYLYPISLAAEGTAEIGGTLAANAGGVHVVRYGMARRSCLGIEVVLADGRVVNLMRSVRKDNTGYDLRDLFIGSEGTLGIITKAVLDLSALPAGRLTVWAPLGSLEAVEKLFETVEKFAGPALTAFELMSEASLDFVYAEGRTSPTTAKSDWTVLFDLALTGRDDPDNMTEGLIEALEPLFDSGDVLDAVLAKNEDEAQALWQLREEIPTAVRSSGGNIKNDISVPRGSLCRFIRETFAEFEEKTPWLTPAIFGHYGDGNLHFNLGNRPELGKGFWKQHEREVHRMVNDAVIRFGGSVAAEHGVGAKAALLERTKDPVELELMKTIRAALDPKGILNPGRVVRWPDNVWRNPAEAWD